MDDGEMVTQLAGEDGELIDLRTNPVCAGRLAAARPDQHSRSRRLILMKGQCY